jgi:hypothetical protein
MANKPPDVYEVAAGRLEEIIAKDLRGREPEG